jgi:RHS repeat-associated protein
VHSDHLGTPRAITDEDQRVVWTAGYEPFGEATVNEDPDRNQQRTALNLRFPGQYADDEAGTYYNYQRDFDPQTGRYRTSDPIGLDGGGNTFAYVATSPLANIDPFGLAGYAVGTGDPVMSPDPGAGVWASEQQTASQLTAKRGIQALLDSGLAALVTGPNAVRHMRHFFDNTGADLTIDLGGLVGSSPDYMGPLFEKELGLAKAFAETLPDGCGIPIASSKATRGSFNPNLSKDWFYAVGRFSYWGSGSLTAMTDKKSGRRTFTLDFEFELYDRYNWDKGKGVKIGAFTVTDDFMAQFHRQGYAREYNIVGTYRTSVTWPE